MTCNKSKKKLKKMTLLVMILMPVLIIMLLFFFIFFNNSNKVKIKENIFTFEYGETINLELKDIINGKEDVLKSAKLNLDSIKYENKIAKVGKYIGIIEYKLNGKQSSLDFNIEVKDTIAPIFIKKEEAISITVSKNVINFENYFEANDLSEHEIIFDDSKIQFDEPGEYILTVSAIDRYANETKIDVKIIIIPSQSASTTKPNNSSCLSTATTPYMVNGIIIVNKKHPLPCGYAPGENKEAKAKIDEMIVDMRVLGYNVSNTFSGYRSYETQEKLYNNYVARDGKALADTYSARPGYSEHQTGLAFDIRVPDNSRMIQAGSKEADWVASNAHLYGYIVRYQSGNQHITGYQAEAWHVRYLGIEMATDIYNSKLTLEEYLGVEGGGYNN